MQGVSPEKAGGLVLAGPPEIDNPRGLAVGCRDDPAVRVCGPAAKQNQSAERQETHGRRFGRRRRLGPETAFRGPGAHIEIDAEHLEVLDIDDSVSVEVGAVGVAGSAELGEQFVVVGLVDDLVAVGISIADESGQRQDVNAQ